MGWPGVLDRRAFVAVLMAAWVFAYLPNLGTRCLRLEEGRRATPAREMLAGGDAAVPTLYGDAYLNKPPLYYWLVALAGTAVGGVNPLATRVPSVLAALGCALVALRFAPAVLDRRTRHVAALFVLASATLLDKGTLGEIDATLGLVFAIALKVWWDGNRPDRQTLRSWVVVGLLLGIAGLLKGPAGPVLFYLTIGPYLVWQRRWNRLLTSGHLVCLTLAVLPAAAWAVLLLERGLVSIPELTRVWGHQIGATNAAAAVADPDARRAELISHYATFPLQVLGMFVPAVVWLPFALSRRWADRRGVPEDVRRFLVCGVLGPCLAVYLYPESRPRHLMSAFFPAAMLAAVVVSGLGRGADRWGHTCSRLGLLFGLVPAVVGAMSVVLAGWACPKLLLAAGGVLSITLVASWATAGLTLQTPDREGPWALAASLSGATLAVWLAVNAVVVPWRAPQSPTPTALQAIEGKLAPEEIVYTTRTFPSTGEGYYNLQFHLAGRVRAVHDLEALRSAAPCTAVVTPGERGELESSGWAVEEVGRLAARGGPPEVYVIRIGAPGERDD